MKILWLFMAWCVLSVPAGVAVGMWLERGEDD